MVPTQLYKRQAITCKFSLNRTPSSRRTNRANAATDQLKFPKDKSQTKRSSAFKWRMDDWDEEMYVDLGGYKQAILGEIGTCLVHCTFWRDGRPKLHTSRHGVWTGEPVAKRYLSAPPAKHKRNSPLNKGIPIHMMNNMPPKLQYRRKLCSWNLQWRKVLEAIPRWIR